jgi:hydrogenase maturation protease
MTKALVIGVGNPSRGDDGFGWRAAELLQTLLDPATTEVMTCRRLTPELSVSMSSADLVIFIRASIDDEPGSIEL